MFRSLLFFIFCTQIGIAQVSLIKGKVVSKNSPLSGASIIINRTKKGTITDQFGNFSLDITNIKNPKITISYLGHKSFNQKIKPNQKNLGTIELILDDELDEIVISGTLKPVSKLNSPIPVEVYSKDYFEGNPTTSVFESLGIINGVRPQINCNVCSTGDIHINGQEGSYTMVLIDGLPIISGLSSVYGLTGIPQSFI